VERLIVIGASSGGVAALRTLFQGFGDGLDAPVLVVQHVGRHRSLLPELLSCGDLRVRQASHGERIERGKYLVAPPDRHLLVEGQFVYLQCGPKEHHTRPAIDPLFRSAALAFRERVIGVVLTGAMDDGTAGLQAIKSFGGVAVVQDPADAAVPDMPRSALDHCEVDHCVPLAEMGALLRRLASAPVTPRAEPAAADLQRRIPEHEMALLLDRGDPFEHLNVIGSPSTITCPDCHGVLWAVKGTDPQRYRCHTGHGFSARSLDAGTRVATEDSVWSCVRSLQERRALLESIRDGERREDHRERLATEIEALRKNTEQLRALAGEYLANDAPGR